MKHSCWTRSSRSLTFAANTLLYVYSIYPLSKGEYLGGFQFFVIKNNDAMHILIHNLVYVSSGVYLAVVKSTSQHSVQISHSVVSDSLRPHGLQHARLPRPSLTPGVYSNSCPSSWWCHPTISSSAVPFSSCPQSFPATRSFPTHQFFTSGGQSIGTSASASVLPMNTQDWSPLGWTGWISLQSMGLSRVFSRVWRKGNPLILLVGMQTSTATMENSVEIP